MATKVLGKVAFTPKLIWNSSITYNIYDTVYDTTANAYYVALKNGITGSSNEPSGNGDGINWTIMCKGIGVTTDNNYTNTDKLKVTALPSASIDSTGGLASYNLVSQNENGIISSFAAKLQAGQITKIKLIGDSITEGYGATGHVNLVENTSNGNPKIFDDGAGTVWYESFYTDKCWANYFRNYITLNFPSVSFINAGIGGKDTTWALANETHWIGTEDVVFVMLGANDRWNITLATYKSQLSQFLTYVKAHCNQMIILTQNPLIGEYNNDGTIQSAAHFTSNEIDRTITELCNENNYSHISFYREMLQYSKITGIDICEFIHDGNHPDDLGHELMWFILQKKLGISENTSKEPIFKNRFGADKQFIINGDFQIAQVCPVVGTEVTNPPSYTYPVCDMWKLGYYVDGSDVLPTTIKHSQRKITASGAAINSVPGSQYCYRINVSDAGTITMSEYDLQNVVINGVSKYCKNSSEVIVSFYARSSISNKKIQCLLQLNYGTGGSPSVVDYVVNMGIPYVTLSNNWHKYSFVFKMPDFNTRTFGTNNDDCMVLVIQFSGTFQNFGGAGDIEIAQVCAGSQFTEFQPKTFEEELRICQRYYEKSYAYFTPIGTANDWDDVESVNSAPNTYFLSSCDAKFKVEKAKKPTVTIYAFDGTPNTIYDSSSSVNMTSSDIQISSRNRYFQISSNTNKIVAGHQYLYQWVADARL